MNLHAFSELGYLVPFLPQLWKSKMGPSNICFLSFRVIFHFHDGRKGISITLPGNVIQFLLLIQTLDMRASTKPGQNWRVKPHPKSQMTFLNAFVFSQGLHGTPLVPCWIRSTFTIYFSLSLDLDNLLFSSPQKKSRKIGMSCSVQLFQIFIQFVGRKIPSPDFSIGQDPDGSSYLHLAAKEGGSVVVGGVVWFGYVRSWMFVFLTI